MTTENAPAPAKSRRGRPFAPGNAGGPGRPKSRADARDTEARLDDLVTRLDGWANLLTKVGVEGRDKRLGNKFYGADRVSVETARELWAGDPEVGRLIERPAEDATREGFELEVPGDEEGARKITDEWRKLGLVEAIEKCLQYRRAYGGGALLLNVDDGQTDLRFPLDEERARGVTSVLAIEARELTPLYYYADPLRPKLGQVAIWRFSPMGVGLPEPGESYRLDTIDIHESRLVIFDGIRTTRQQYHGALAGWGESVLTRVWGAIRGFASAFGASESLVEDFGQAVYKIKGLAQILATDNGNWFKARLQAIQLARSTMGSIFVDADHEDFVRTQTPVAGLPELLRLQMERVAAAAEMPVTLFWGISAGGLNATGENDMRGYYDRVKAGQTRWICPPLERVSGLIARGLGIKIPEDTRMCVTPNPLWQASELETAQARSAQATTDIAYLGVGVLTPDEVRASRFGSGKFSFETSIEDEAGTELPEVTDEDVEAMGGAPKPVDPAGASPTPESAQSGSAAPGVAMPTLGGGPDAVEPAKTAFTGVQVTAMIEVISKVNLGELSRESGAAILALAYPVTPEQAQALLGPEDFEPTKPEPPAGFGGGFGGPPGGKPGAQPPGAPGKDTDQPPGKTPPKPGALKAE